MEFGSSSDCETTGVVICGAGPTGALLSALLGRMNVPNILLEREEEIATDPRGIALDEEAIRLIQSIGMYHRVHTEIALCQDLRCLNTGQQRDLHKQPFLSFDLTSSDGGTGHVGIAFHKQPELEKAIRESISEASASELRSGCRLVGITEDAKSVQVDYVDRHGSTKTISASFLVGADGKTGFVRKQYLEANGISMNICEGTDYDETWVAANWRMDLPTESTHPGFLLWKLGYTPEQVFDTFFPLDFRFLCDPSRAAVCGRFGPPSERLWRFEFVVLPNEDPREMALEENASKIIWPYLTHEGSRYGLSSPVTYPKDCVTILRSRPFHFSARSCNKWSMGRVILAGDAAHVFPPFGGQGISSGFRDASSLAWRLSYLCNEPKVDHERVLRGWYTERKQQFERSLVQTVKNGQVLTNKNTWKAMWRDWSLWLLQLSPSIKWRLERGARLDGMTRYRQDNLNELPFIARLGGGLNIPQVYARDLLSGKLMFTDDLIFSLSNKGLFQLLILADGFEDALKAFDQTKGLSERSGGRLREDEATILIHDLNVQEVDKDRIAVKTARIASGEEFGEDELCRGRPIPRLYDPFRIRKEVGRAKMFVILRPDRYVYAACSTAGELFVAVDSIADALCTRR